MGVAVGALATVAIKAASDQNEQLNRTRVVFGQASDEVVRFADTAAESFGISKTAALEASASMGAIFDSAGIAQGAAADLSLQMVELAADMASFNNQDPSEMLERLRSGLAGEAEPLRRFGVFISEARVQTEAYRTGLAEVGEELTDAQKVQARFNIIMQDTAKQQGDFARTVGESIPNQMRKLKAQVTDLAASLGQILIPIVLRAVEALNFLLTPLIEVGDALARLGTFTPPESQVRATEDWASAARDLSNAWHEGRITQDAYAEGLVRIGAEFEGDQPVLIRQVEHYLALRDSWREAEKESNRLADGLNRQGKEMDGAASAVRKFGLATKESFDSIASSIRGELPGIIGTVTTYKETFSLSPNELKKITATWAEIGKTIARDLRAIANSDLQPAMKAAIASLPPEMRHAWVEGNNAQRAAIQASILSTYGSQAIIDRLAGQLRSGGASAGRALGQGMTVGIRELNAAVAAAAVNQVTGAIAAARRAARASSPSKAMMELGRDLIEGLRLGLEEGEPLADQMNAIIHSMIQNMRNVLPAWQKAIKGFESELERLRGRMNDLRSAVAGGFGGFLDISGGLGEGAPDAGTFIREQLASAQRFASVLKALGSRGISAGLLSEIAGQGPEATPFAQQLLQMSPSELKATNKAYNDIANIADKTARSLSESYFGERIKDVRGDLHDIRQDLHAVEFRLEKLREIEVEQKKGDIILQIDGRELARIARDELNRIGSRNATTGLRN